MFWNRVGFWRTLKVRGFTFFAGVPDSTFQSAYVGIFHDPDIQYIPASGEDVALGAASATWPSNYPGESRDSAGTKHFPSKSHPHSNSGPIHYVAGITKKRLSQREVQQRKARIVAAIRKPIPDLSGKSLGPRQVKNISRRAGGSYSEVKRKLDIFLLRHSATDESRLGTIVDELDTIGGRLSQLERESPDIPDPLYDQARRVFEEGPMVASWKTIKVALVL